MACRRMFCFEPERPKHRNELSARWIMLMLLCSGMFGSYYVFDIPAATEATMQRELLGSTNGTDCVNGTAINVSTNGTDTFNSDFNLLYSVYSWPNIILPFFGGIISDKVGVRLMGVLFMGLITFGQLIVALGSSYLTSDSSAAWATMWVGRTVFGFGGESLSVVQSAFIASYFQGKELALALGVGLALARVGSVINNELSAVIASNLSVALAYWVGFGICVLGFAGTVWAYYLDVRCENKLRGVKGLKPLQGVGLLNAFCRILCCKGAPPQDNTAPVLEKQPLVDDGRINSEADEVAEPAIKEEINFRAVLKFPLIFWVLTLSCLTIYIDVLTFNNNCADFVTQKYLADKPLWQVCPEDQTSLYLPANTIMSITYLVAGFLTPVFGSVCDFLGLRAVLNVFAAMCITSVHVVLGLTSFFPALPLVVLGLCYSIYAAALWPSIAIVIEPAAQATAYGIVTAVQNFGLAVSPLIVGTLMPSPNCATKDICDDGWRQTELFFVYLGAAGVCCGIALNIVDYFWSPVPLLNLSDAAVKKLLAAKEAAQAGGGAVADGDAHTVALLSDDHQHHTVEPMSIAPPSPVMPPKKK